MKCFTYTISDPQGLHARNAIGLCRIAGNFHSQITAFVQEENGNQKKADCKDMMALMGLRARQNATVEFTVEGEDEQEAAAGLTAALPTIL